MGDVFTLVAKLTLDSAEFDRKLGLAKEKASGIGGTIAGAVGVGVKAFTAVTAAAGAFATASVKAGSDFDTAMSQVQATMLKTADEMQNELGTAVLQTADGIQNFSGNLREFAQFLGENTAFSATQAAEALNFMALAGYTTQQSMDMLPNVLNLAAAGAMDLATASDMVTDTQTAFGISAERTTQMVDEMAKAASTGNTNVQQLGEAFLVVGGLAQELNGGFVYLEDGTEVAVDGIQELEIALTAMANAGIKGSEAGTHMRNMIMKLSKPTKDGAETMKQLGLNVFDAEGNMRSIASIMVDLGNAMGNMSQEEKIGAIANLFNTRDLASAEALLSAVEQDWDKIGASILEANGSAAEMAAIQLDNLEGDKSAGALKDAFKTGDFSGVFDVLTNIVTEAVGTAVKSAPQFAEIGFSILSSIGEGIMNNADGLLGLGQTLLSGLVTGIIEGLPVVTEGAVGILNGIADGIRENLPQLIPIAMETLMNFSGSLRENVGLLVDAGLNLIKALGDSLIQNLPVFIQTVPTIVTNIAGIINDNAPKLIATGIELIGKLLAGIVEAVPVIIEEFPKILQAIASVITAFNWIGLGQNIINFLTNGVKSLVTSLPDAIKDIINTSGDIVKNFNWMSLGRGIIEVLKQGIQSLVNDVPNALLNIAKNAATTFKAFDWLSLGAHIISGIVSGITDGAGQVLTAIGGLANNVLNAGKKALGIASPSKIFKYYGKMIDEGLALGISNNTGIVDRAMSDLIGTTEPSEGFAGTGIGGTFAPVISINVYGTENQSAQEIGEAAIEAVNAEIKSLRGVWGHA